MSYRNARFRPLEPITKRALYDLPRPEVARMPDYRMIIFDEDDETVVVDRESVRKATTRPKLKSSGYVEAAGPAWSELAA